MPNLDTQRLMFELGASRVFVCPDEDYGGWGTWRSVQQISPTTLMQNVFNVKFSAVFPYPIGSFMELFTWLHGKLRAMVRKIVERPEDTDLLVIQKPNIDDTEMRNRTGRRISISAKVSFDPIPITNGLMRFEQREIREYIRWTQAYTGLTPALFCSKYKRKQPSPETIAWMERWHKR